MAASVNIFGPLGTPNFARRDPYERLTRAMNGDQYELRRMQRGIGNMRESADTYFRATTDTNTAAGEANVALNLSTALGLTVASGAIASGERRDIFIECSVRDVANGRRYNWVQKSTIGVSASELVIVGRNPVFITSCDAVVSCTSANGTTMTEVAAECIPPAWWDGASPVAADVASNATTISWLGGNAPVGTLICGEVACQDAAGVAADARAYMHGAVSLANGTSSVVISDVATPTLANLTAGATFWAQAKITPPMSAVLGIGPTPAPDQLILSLVGVGSTALAWEVGVTIGDAYGTT